MRATDAVSTLSVGLSKGIAHNDIASILVPTDMRAAEDKHPLVLPPLRVGQPFLDDHLPLLVGQPGDGLERVAPVVVVLVDVVVDLPAFELELRCEC
jgi:hypothetical protein